jgi:hypothetical protein
MAMETRKGEIRVYGSTISVWEKPHRVDDEYEAGFLDAVMYPGCRSMMARGWAVRKDPNIEKNYPSLSKGHRVAEHFDGTKCKIRQSGRSLEFAFIRRSDSYLAGIRVKFEMHLILAHLIRPGYTVRPERKPCDAFNLTANEWLMIQHEKSGRARCPSNEIASYNKKCADGVARNGDRMFFVDYNGRWGVGIVEHNINNMWWVKVGKWQVRNICCAYMQHAPPENPRRKLVNGTKRLKQLMLEAASELRYSDAARMHRVLIAKGVKL